MISLTQTLFIVLCIVHSSVQLNNILQMTSASYKRIEVEEESWMQASGNESRTFLTDNIKG